MTNVPYGVGPRTTNFHTPQRTFWVSLGLSLLGSGSRDIAKLSWLMDINKGPNPASTTGNYLSEQFTLLCRCVRLASLPINRYSRGHPSGAHYYISTYLDSDEVQ